MRTTKYILTAVISIGLALALVTMATIQSADSQEGPQANSCTAITETTDGLTTYTYERAHVKKIKFVANMYLMVEISTESQPSCSQNITLVSFFNLTSLNSEASREVALAYSSMLYESAFLAQQRDLPVKIQVTSDTGTPVGGNLVGFILSRPNW